MLPGQRPAAPGRPTAPAALRAATLLLLLVAGPCEGLIRDRRRSRLGNGAPSTIAAAQNHFARIGRASAAAQRSNASHGLDYASESVESNCGMRTAWSGPTLSMTAGSPRLKEWLDLSLPEEPLQVVKPAFLMMLYAKMVFGKAWESFFRYGGIGTSLLILHSKLEDAEIPEYFRPYVMPERIGSRRCHDTALMISMMSLALADTSVSHVVIISGDTLPLKPLHSIVQDLEADTRTRFCADLAWQRAETWFVMRRDHASLFSLHHHELRRLIPWTDCEDEDLFYWPLAIRREDTTNKCVMMTDWSNTDKAWKLNSMECQCHAYLASKKETGSCARPAMFHDVSEEGLDDLLASPASYWFARKFLGDAYAGVSAANVDGQTTYNGTGLLDDEMARRITEASRTVLEPVAAS